VLLDWAPVDGATGYTVTWHATDSTTTGSLDAGGTSLAVTGLVAGQPYAFEVRARRYGTIGPAGPGIVVTPSGTVTQAPPRPGLSRVHGHRVRIRWEAAVDATRYQILVRRPGHGWSTLAWTTGIRHVTPRLRAGARYSFKVQPWHQLIPGYTSPAARISVR
jgi:hypothetical protein